MFTTALQDKQLSKYSDLKMNRPQAGGFPKFVYQPPQTPAAKSQFAYQSPRTTVANVHRAELQKHGYKDLEDWLRNPNHVYIGRDMTRHIPGAVGSKWGNPFKSRRVEGKEERVRMYREHIMNSNLFACLGELKGKTLGCWCHPEQCHGHILVELVEEYYLTMSSPWASGGIKRDRSPESPTSQSSSHHPGASRQPQFTYQPQTSKQAQFTYQPKASRQAHSHTPKQAQFTYQPHASKQAHSAYQPHASKQPQFTYQPHASKQAHSQPQSTSQSQTSSVVNIRKAELNKRGYKDLQDWLSNPDNVYIGRNMTFYVPGAEGSKWRNPFNAKKFGREECCKMYKEHVLNTKELLDSLSELKGKTLGCWCHPEMCHGHMLVELMEKHCK